MTGNKSLMAFVIAGLSAGVMTVAAFSATQARENDGRGRDGGEHVTPRCLDGQRTGRFHVVDDHTLLVYDTFGNPYQLDVGGPCRGMSDMSQFGFEFNGSTDICKAHDAALLRREAPAGGTWRCLINGVKPLSRAEAEALDRG